MEKNSCADHFLAQGNCNMVHQSACAPGTLGVCVFMCVCVSDLVNSGMWIQTVITIM